MLSTMLQSYNSSQQWRSQNAEEVTHIKGKLLDQAKILFNCIPLQKNLLPEGMSSFLYEQSL